MFNNKNKSNSKFALFAAADSVSSIAQGMVVHGDIEAEHDMRIDGIITGNIFCKSKIVVGPTATITGDINVGSADILGTVHGNITAKELLCLKSRSIINGNITVGRLDIEPEAEFNGTCHMVHEQDAKSQPNSYHQAELSLQQ